MPDELRPVWVRRDHWTNLGSCASWRMHLTGFHHLTAVTANVAGNFAFYTQTLGMRLVKKTVNQDDVSAYHLFYADGMASPGTDITFFDWPVRPERRGTHSVVRTGFRVDSEATLEWWAGRLQSLDVKHDGISLRDGRAVLDFEDPEGQRLSLLAEVPKGQVHPWLKSPVPAEHQLRGLGPVTLSVSDLDPSDAVLTKVMAMRRVREYGAGSDGRAAPVHVYEMGPHVGADPRASGAVELHLAVEPHLPPARSGAGGVHHVAFRTPTFAEYDAWVERLRRLDIPSSGPVNRFYFRSLYFREPNGILFEIATDEPGFAADEPIERLGERLALPPFLEPRRGQIEAGLRKL